MPGPTVQLELADWAKVMAAVAKAPIETHAEAYFKMKVQLDAWMQAQRDAHAKAE